MGDGNFIKLYRETLRNPTVMKDAEHLAIWTWLLLNATYCPRDVIFGGKRITLNAGELTTGRKRIADELRVSESKVQRVLKTFEDENMIEQRTDRQCRLISIVSWSEYQNVEQRVNNDCFDFDEINEENSSESEQRVNNANAAIATDSDTSDFESEQRLNNERTTTEQRLNTNKENKNKRNKEDNNITPAKATKHKYGEYKHVSLTDAEYERLVDEFGSDADEAIRYLDEYKERKGYKSKNDNLTLRKWVFEAINRERAEKRTNYSGLPYSGLDW